jgi:hypothetical protein
MYLQFHVPQYECVGGLNRLTADWTVFVVHKRKGGCDIEKYVVPKGFTWDGASIPRWLWWICGTPNRAPRKFAACFHDWVYGTATVQMKRSKADAIFRQMQVDLGTHPFPARVEWAMVRLFGRSHWTSRPAGGWDWWRYNDCPPHGAEGNKEVRKS